MANRLFMLGKQGPLSYDPTLDYKDRAVPLSYASGFALVYTAKVGGANATIYHASALFITEGFVVGDIIEIRQSPSNDGYYIIENLTETTLYISPKFDLISETDAAGDSIISTPLQAAYMGLDATFGGLVVDGRNVLRYALLVGG